MRHFAPLTAFLALLATPALATASTVTLTDYPAPGAFSTNAPGGGGPFLAQASDSTLGSLGSFITFCIEYSEEFYYGGTYNYELSSGARNGGIGGQDPVGSNFDPLDDATRWLYGEVVSGGYSAIAAFGTGSGVGSRVQEAIWFIEGERTQAQIGLDSFALAQYASSNWSALPEYSIFAMNLTDSSGGRHQDQLAYRYEPPSLTFRDPTPVPEPAALVLMGSGLLVASRKFRRQKVKK